MVFKIRWEKAGGHIHCTLFSAPRSGATFANCGSFCIREDEFDPMRATMPGVFFEEKTP